MPQVSIPIIDQLIHPSVGLLSFALIGTQTGPSLVTYNPPQGPLAFTYGLNWEIVAVDPGLGLRPGVVDVYFDRVLQVGALYNTFGGGPTIFNEIQEFYNDNGNWFWAEALPSSIQVFVGAGFGVSLAWLQT